jgi:uncharacterized protein YneF (UPF0154 family)
MEKTDTRRFQIFFAGASVAFGFPLLIGEILGGIAGTGLSDDFSETLSILYILLHLIGGLIGGALVARNVSEQETIKSGAITGLLAYVFHQIIFFIFFGAGVIGDPYTLVALIGGSIVGAFLYGKMSKR